jgi:phage-related minor tail protein
MGREFERAVQSAAPGVRDLADGLRAAIAATIQEIEANRLHAVES